MSSVEQESEPYYLYHYYPNIAPAILYIVVYFLLLVLQAFQWIKIERYPLLVQRIRYIPRKIKLDYEMILIPAFVGSIFEIVGMIGRILGRDKRVVGYINGVDDKSALGPYVVQSIFLLVAPPLYAASIYMAYGRFLIRSRTSTFCISTRWITTFFVTGDVLSFLIQGTGGGLMATSDTLEAGKYIVVGGLCVQIIFFGFFMISTIKTAVDLRKKGVSFEWKWFFIILFCSSVLIMIRSIYRIVEFAQGMDGYLMSHEWWLYVFDSAIIFIAAFMIIGFNFSYYLCLLYNKMQDIDIAEKEFEASDF